VNVETRFIHHWRQAGPELGRDASDGTGSSMDDLRPSDQMVMVAGICGGASDGSAALVDEGGLVGVCAQERVTRVRGAGLGRSGLPDEALNELLARLGRSLADIGRYVHAAPGGDEQLATGADGVEHHFAHACTAYLTSPFTDTAVLVCDREAPQVTVWRGTGPSVSRVEWPWEGTGLAEVYSRCASAFGFGFQGGDQRFEALARLRPDSHDARVTALLSLDDAEVIVAPSLEEVVAERIAGQPDPGSPARAALAAALQARIGELFLDLLGRVRGRLGVDRLCLGGSLAHHSSMNTLARRSGLFREVFVPVDPGNAGLAVGAALTGAGAAPAPASPFLGPAYSAEEIKAVLDNCKLQYAWETEESALSIAVRALARGQLVGWFDGGMEWGPRALGARCILANPGSPYVLENLNHFLKRREPWRGYALSSLEASVATWFDGPDAAPFMECDYRPRDGEAFRHVLPSRGAAVRVQTVGAGAPSRFRRLLEAFADATGLPCLVNTSFNGFHEPIVCSPRDAVRVFYGSGLDLLVAGPFVIRK
jgi:carbamoyltransferase